MPTWTPQQLRCLEALNIPVMAFAPPSGSGDIESSTAKPATTEANSTTEVTATTTKANSTTEAAATSETASTAEVTATTEAPTTYFYRLGPWFFHSSTQLPVTGIQWVNDLAAYADTRLSQTSKVGDALNIDPYIQRPLTPEQKRELWDTLKAHLNK